MHNYNEETIPSSIFPGQNTGVGCHALLHGTFPTQVLNPDVLGDSLPDSSASGFFIAEPWGSSIAIIHYITVYMSVSIYV